jgi:uncharacterized protein YndB with AHSA1/START domain
MEAQMPYAFTLSTTIPASAQEIYDAWLDSRAHSQMTGGEAIMTDEVGAEVTAWDGYITGRNLALVPAERIVQAWRTTKFTDEHQDSIITLTLEEVDDGTLLTLVHSNVPDEQTSYERGGWQQHYFEPMKAYFSKPASSGPRAKAAKPKAKAKAATKSKTKSKLKRAASRTKTKPAVKRAKAAGKKKVKRAAAKAKPKSAKKAKRKAAKRKAAKGKSRR